MGEHFSVLGFYLIVVRQSALKTRYMQSMVCSSPLTLIWGKERVLLLPTTTENSTSPFWLLQVMLKKRSQFSGCSCPSSS